MFRTGFRIAACCTFLVLSVAAQKPKPPKPPSKPAALAPPEAFPLKKAKSFDTITATRFLGRQAVTNTVVGDRFGISVRGAAVTIRYDPGSGSYIVKDDLATATFRVSSPTSTSNGFDIYTKNSGTVSDTLKVYVNARSGAPQTSAPVKLTYLSFAAWSHTDSASGADRKTYLLFGYPTAAADMPRTGSASYKTFVTGTRTELSPNFSVWRDSEIGGSASFTANFATGRIDTQLVINPLFGTGSYGTFVGTGAMSGDSQFSGTFASSIPTFVSGNFDGGFYGPGAKDMGYTFVTYQYNPDPYAGAAADFSSAFMTGTVVGTKN